MDNLLEQIDTLLKQTKEEEFALQFSNPDNPHLGRLHLARHSLKVARALLGDGMPEISRAMLLRSLMEMRILPAIRRATARRN